MIRTLSLVHGRMSRTHSTDNYNDKSARYRQGIASVAYSASRHRRNLLPSARRRRGSYFIMYPHKNAVSQESRVQLRFVAVPNDNSKGKSSFTKYLKCHFDPKLFVTS